MNPRRPSIFLIGCGRVGCTIALGLKQAGYRIAGVRDRDPKAERRARKLLGVPGVPGVLGVLGGSTRRLLDPEIGVLGVLGGSRDCGLRIADLVLIGTPDSQIAAAYREIASELRDEQTVVHFSGALPSATLCRSDCSLFPGGRLAMHPVMTFPAILPPSTHSPLPVGEGPGVRAYFALEGNRQGIRAGRSMVRALGARAIVIRAEDKPVFHAACAVASNFTTVVLDAALELARHAGLKPGKAWRVLAPLVRATLSNVEHLGSLRALSGPIERADHETVRRHLIAIRASNPELVPLYKALAAHALAMTKRKRTLSPAALRAMRKLLAQP